MGKVNLLDCTLRDGVYINEWNFGKKGIKAIVQKLEKTGKLLIFRPEREVCDLFATDRSLLDDTYKMGYEYAKQRMGDLKAFMEI